jgi:transcriptional regulator with XRE-family HTH domain
VPEPQVVTEARRALGRQLAALRSAAGYSQIELAPLTGYERSTVANVEVGRQNVGRDFWERADGALAAGGTLTRGYDDLRATVRRHAREVAQAREAERATKLDQRRSSRLAQPAAPPSVLDDEEDALELARRVTASDVGTETLGRLESVVDDLAVAYSVTPPRQLLQRVRLHLGYVGRLVDSRKTLSEHRRLLVVGGWLSLLGATIHVDLGHNGAATARLRTAQHLARQAEHPEIAAWCLETEAWRQLTEGNYPEAVALSQAAQQRAPRGSSAAIQAAAQEGRACARLGHDRETYAAISRVGELVAPLSRPDRPEHHYRYDPDKCTAYIATTLAWVGDPAAEAYARETIARLRGAEHDGKWPRRVATANLDLALTLLAANRLDEAVGAAHEAISSGRVVPSSHWRALEVVRAVENRQPAEAKDLREAYEVMRRGE